MPTPRPSPTSGQRRTNDQATDYVAIDFGTSNSAVAMPHPAQPGAAYRVGLVELEPGQQTMPTAVFYRADTPATQPEAERLFGRAAIAAYVQGQEGRLMRSMKSILGSTLLDQSTDVGGGRSARYRDVVTGYLRHLKGQAETQAGHALTRVVLGRPVFFVDDDLERDAQAQAALASAAQAVGFTEIAFQFEPIAAALDHESRCTREQLVLVVDIGGGTSDFSLVRVGPQRRGRRERRDDILANHGVHVAGTDFDRRVALEAIMPLLGYRSLRPARAGESPREVPSGIYFDLSTWHLINTLYNPARLSELRGIRTWYAQPQQHTRLISVLQEHWGHALAAAAENAKIDMATQGHAHIDLSMLERGLVSQLSSPQGEQALEADWQRIVHAAQQTLQQAGVQATQVDALYFTGGSTGLTALTQRISALFPQAQAVRGDRFSSVAQGLGWHAQAVFGA